MKSVSPTTLAQLRKQAERAIGQDSVQGIESFENVRDYIQELQIYQAELEMQADELLRTQRELEASRDQYWELYNRAPVGYLSLNHSGIITMVNQTFADMLGTSCEQLIHKPLSRFVIPEEHTLFFTVCRRAASSEGFHSFEIGFLRDDRSTFYGRLDLTPHTKNKDDGAEPYYRVSVIDITDKRNAEQERLRLEQEVLKSQKEESLRRFAGGIAHNFNNLLTIIMGNVELARDTVSNDLMRGQFLDTVFEASERAAELSKMMLSYLGYPPSCTVPVDIGTTAANVQSVIRGTMPAGIEMAFEPPISPVCVLGDPVQLVQVINSLLENSIEAIGEGRGRITVRVRFETVRPNTTLPMYHGETVRPGRYGCIEIEDTGCGMDSLVLEKAVDPFYTTNFTGRGLGLSVVWGIIRAHNGYLLLESEPGEGTMARLYLPLCSDGGRTGSAPSVATHAQVPAGTTVLYVDDDPIVRSIGKKLLEGRGYTVLEAGGGREAVAIIRASGENIACVVLDYAMPDMDGNLTLVEIRRLMPGMPALLVSGFLKEQAVDGFLTEKPSGFLQKPFRRAEFIKMVEAVISSGDNAKFDS